MKDPTRPLLFGSIRFNNSKVAPAKFLAVSDDCDCQSVGANQRLDQRVSELFPAKRTRGLNRIDRCSKAIFAKIVIAGRRYKRPKFEYIAAKAARVQLHMRRMRLRSLRSKLLNRLYSWLQSWLYRCFRSSLHIRQRIRLGSRLRIRLGSQLRGRWLCLRRICLYNSMGERYCSIRSWHLS